MLCITAFTRYNHTALMGGFYTYIPGDVGDVLTTVEMAMKEGKLPFHGHNPTIDMMYILPMAEGGQAVYVQYLADWDSGCFIPPHCGIIGSIERTGSLKEAV